MADKNRGSAAKAGAGGGFGFLVCLIIGIVFDQVALGIIAGLIFGAAIGRALIKKTDETETN